MGFRKVLVAVSAAAIATLAVADDDPRHVRHELMEDVGDAARVLGGMLKGERPYDAEAAMASLKTWEDVSMRFGDLFPEGSESGKGTEAAPAIWEDREGFNEALGDWRDAIAAAVAADAATLDEAKPLLGAAFETCKGCHNAYRIADE